MSETLDFTEKICNDGFILACHVTLSVSGVKIGVKWGVKRMPPAKATGGVFYVGNSNNIIE